LRKEKFKAIMFNGGISRIDPSSGIRIASESARVVCSKCNSRFENPPAALIDFNDGTGRELRSSGGRRQGGDIVIINDEVERGWTRSGRSNERVTTGTKCNINRLNSILIK